ncbi:MAG: hypothetical protein MJ000_11165 [Bacteroidales bacterium]|nr:hypothetical protein [Bacteroidales bacterium]
MTFSTDFRLPYMLKTADSVVLSNCSQATFATPNDFPLDGLHEQFFLQSGCNYNATKNSDQSLK